MHANVNSKSNLIGSVLSVYYKKQKVLRHEETDLFVHAKYKTWNLTKFRVINVLCLLLSILFAGKIEDFPPLGIT